MIRGLQRNEFATITALFLKIKNLKVMYQQNKIAFKSLFFQKLLALKNNDLLKKCIDSFAKNEKDKTQLANHIFLLAIKRNDIDAAMFLKSHYRVDINKSNKNGETALSIALTKKHSDAIEFVIALGAKPTALKAGVVEVLAFVLKNGNYELFPIILPFISQKDIKHLINSNNTKLNIFRQLKLCIEYCINLTLISLSDTNVIHFIKKLMVSKHFLNNDFRNLLFAKLFDLKNFSLLKKYIDIFAKDKKEKTQLVNQLLLFAVKCEDVMFVYHLISDYKANVNIKDIDGQSPISLALSKHESARIATLLQKYGANISPYQQLTLAVKQGNPYLVDEILGRLYDNQIVNYCSNIPANELFELFNRQQLMHIAKCAVYADNLTLITKLQLQGNQTNYTFYQYLSFDENLQKAYLYLLKKNALINATDKYQNTLLGYAVAHNDRHLQGLLFAQGASGLNTQVPVLDNNTPLAWLLRNEHEVLLIQWCNMFPATFSSYICPVSGDNILHIALQRNHIDLVNSILKKNSRHNVDKLHSNVNKNGLNPLHIAAQKGQNAKNYSVLAKLIPYCSVNTIHHTIFKNENNNTLLHKLLLDGEYKLAYNIFVITPDLALRVNGNYLTPLDYAHQILATMQRYNQINGKKDLTRFINEVNRHFSYRNQYSYHSYSDNAYEPIGSSSEQAKLNNAFIVLGLDSNADFNAVKKARNNLAKVYHPDKFKPNPNCSKKDAAKKIIEINKAFDLLDAHFNPEPKKRIRQETRL